MWKKDPKEKDKILQRLTEKEIKEQLYGYKAHEISALKTEPPKDVLKESQPLPKQKLTLAEKNIKTKAKNPYLVWQIMLLAVFLTVIWFSIRQIIKIVFREQHARISNQEAFLQNNNIGKIQIKSNALQYKHKSSMRKQ